MATVQPWIPMTEKIWTDEEKEAWLAAHGDGATHVVTFEPMYQIELCIPPWEQPDRQIARSAVAWGQNMSRVFATTTTARRRWWRPITRATPWRSTAR